MAGVPRRHDARDDLAAARAERVVHQVEQVGVADEGGRALAVEDGPHLRRGEARVHEQRVRARLAGGHERLDEPAVVAARDRDAVPLDDAPVAQRDGERGGARLELGVRQRAVAVDERQPVRIAHRGRGVRAGRRRPPRHQAAQRDGDLVGPQRPQGAGPAEHGHGPQRAAGHGGRAGHRGRGLLGEQQPLDRPQHRAGAAAQLGPDDGAGQRPRHPARGRAGQVHRHAGPVAVRPHAQAHLQVDPRDARRAQVAALVEDRHLELAAQLGRADPHERPDARAHAQRPAVDRLEGLQAGRGAHDDARLHHGPPRAGGRDGQVDALRDAHR